MAKKKAEECPKCEAWITSFADLMSLLCIFFVLLFSMANTDLKNFAQVAEALRIAFNNGGGPALSVIGSTEGGSTSNAGTTAPIFFDSLAPRRRDFLSVTNELTILANQLGVGDKANLFL
jgi:chemotaxis protein MotB